MTDQPFFVTSVTAKLLLSMAARVTHAQPFLVYVADGTASDAY
jgi:hypothetical protein